MFALKTIKPDAVSAAMQMVERYRLLNEPDEAVSICLDILAIVPDHQDAIVNLLLALTDKFSDGQLFPAFEQAKDVLGKLESPYCQVYYAGILFERRAKHHLKKGGPGAGTLAHEWLVKAMEAFDKAMQRCDPGNQNALLRWNSCARLMNSRSDIKSDDIGREEMLLDAYDTPH